VGACRLVRDFELLRAHMLAQESRLARESLKYVGYRKLDYRNLWATDLSATGPVGHKSVDQVLT